MITYNLALKLYKVGFPLIEIKAGMTTYNREAFDANPSGNRKIGAKHFFFPTLEELIEACGDRFEAVVQRSKVFYIATAKIDPNLILEIDKDTFENPNQIQVKGKTLSEAVVKLYIKLNEKPNT